MSGAPTAAGSPAALEAVRLYLITGARPGADLARALAASLAAVPPGGAAVQVRAKDLSTRDLFEIARRAVEVAAPRRAPVLVNDRVDVALAAGADGVHLPERGFAPAEARRAAGSIPIAVGASAHSAEGAARAADAGADLVVLGPIFDTPSKAALGMAPLGEDAIAQARARLASAGAEAPLFALGGIIDAEAARKVGLAGAHGVAGIRGVLDAPDPAAAARDLWRALA